MHNGLLVVWEEGNKKEHWQQIKLVQTLLYTYRHSYK